MGLAGGRGVGESRWGREAGTSWGVAVHLLCHKRHGALPCPSLRSHVGGGRGQGR